MYIKSLALGPVMANCYVIADLLSGEGAVIDPGDYNSLLELEIRKSGMKNLKYILCTHGHFDHVSGVGRLKEKYPEARVMIGSGDEGASSSPFLSVSEFFGAEFYPFSYDAVLKNGDEFALGSIEFKAIASPGHTPGGMLFCAEKENALFTGDTLFCGSIGRTDMPGGDSMALIGTLRKFREFPETMRIYSGHGEMTDIKTELKFNPYLR